MPDPRAAALEAVQFLPLLSFAAPFVVAGEVDLSAAGGGFAIGAALAVAVSGALAAKKVAQNPILLGVNAWLLVGAAAFAAVEPLAAWIASVQAASLFVGVLAVGAAAAALAPGGFVGDPRAPRWASWALVALAGACLGWSLAFPDIRVGGALPFIALNVVRRVMLRRLVPS